MIVSNADDSPEQLGSDPRWEVRPDPVETDGSGSSLRTIGIAIIALVVFATLLVWLVSIVPPAA